MLWTELELDRVVPDDHIDHAFAVVFDVGEDQVAIVDDVTTVDPWADRRVRIVLDRHCQPGDCPLHVMVILGDESLDERVATPAHSLAAVHAICAALGCRALISDDNPNPYRWILVTPETGVTSMRVDPRQLDECGAFVLAPLPTTAETAA